MWLSALTGIGDLRGCRAPTREITCGAAADAGSESRRFLRVIMVTGAFLQDGRARDPHVLSQSAGHPRRTVGRRDGPDARKISWQTGRVVSRGAGNATIAAPARYMIGPAACAGSK